MASSDDSSAAPHIVAIAFLSQGHINPLIHFCFQLAEQGINVTFATINIKPAVLGRPDASRDPEIPPHLSASFSLRPLDFQRPTRLFNEELPLHERAKMFFQAMDADLEAPFEQLVQRAQDERGRKVRCIISDCMYHWTQAVARRLGVPRVGFWTASLAALNVDYHAPLLLVNDDVPVSENNAGKIISYIPGFPPFPASSLPFMFHKGSMMNLSDPHYEKMIARSVVLKDDAWVVVNSMEALEPQVFEAVREAVNKRCIGVGPILPPRFLGPEEEEEETISIPSGAASLWKQEKDCLTWLDQQASASVLYISFGSAAQLSRAEFNELCRALETSKQSFLWAFRSGTCVQGLSEDDVRKFEERLGSTGLITGWVPQVEVLLHRSIGAFLTHCGWNSVLEGICGGVPMLGWPKLAEQNLNCEFLVSRGIGVRLTGELYKPLAANEIAARIDKAMSDSEVREKTRALQAATRSAAKKKDSPTQEFISYVKSHT